MADRVPLDRGRTERCRDRGLSLKRNDMAKRLPPIHPGEVLREEFLLPMKLSPYALAQACGVPRTRIERLAREETPVTADTALRARALFRQHCGILDGLAGAVRS